MTDDVDSSGTQHVEVLICEGLRRSNDDGVTSVNTQRVEVLHVANSNAVVSSITNNFVLDFLPALHTLFNKNLGTGGESLGTEVLQLIHVVGKSTTQTTKSVGGTDNDWELDFLDNLESFLERRSRCRLGALLVDRFHAACEHFTVFSSDDGIDRSTENLHTKPLKFILELDTDLEGGLTTKCHIDGIGSLMLDDLAHKVSIDRKEIDLIRQPLGRLDCSNVGVDQDGVDSLFLQGLDGLTSRVVELSGLTNAQTTTSQNQHLPGKNARCQLDVLLFRTTGEGHRLLEGLRGGNGGLDGVDENIEEELGVPGTRRAFRVELDTEVWAADMTDTLVGAVICIHEEFLPALGQARGIHGVTVVLRCDVALARDHASAGNVMATVTELHLLSLGTGGACNQLVTQTDTEDGGSAFFEGFGQVCDGGGGHGRVTGTVGDEQTIIVLPGEVREIIIPGNNQDFNSTGKQATQLVEFQTHVQAKYPDWTAGGVFEGNILRRREKSGFLEGDYSKKTSVNNRHSLPAVRNSKTHLRSQDSSSSGSPTRPAGRKTSSCPCRMQQPGWHHRALPRWKAACDPACYPVDGCAW